MSVPDPQLVTTLLSNAVLVIPLALLVALVCRFVRRPAVVWCLWAMVLLKFVTPAWYPLPVEDFAAALTPTDHVSQLDESEPTHVPLLTSAAPVAVPLPEVDEPATLVEQLAMSQLYESLHRPLPLVEETEFPDDLPPFELSMVEPIESPTGDMPRPMGGAWRELSEEPEIPETSATPFLVSDRANLKSESQAEDARSWSFPDVAFPNWNLGTSVSVLMGVWIVGSVTLLCLTFVRVWRFQRLVRRAGLASDELTHTVQKIATRLGCRRVPEVRVTSGRVPPLLWVVGWKPVILLPTGLLTQLDDEQQSALLTHELAHYARRDHWTRWFELAVRCLYWWHPVAWWAGHRLREAEEQCCDAWVVSLTPDAARPYANALLTTLDFLNPPDQPVPALASSITPLRRSLHPFHRRLTMILEDHPSPTLTWTTRLCLLAVAVIVLPLSLFAVAAETEQETPKATIIDESIDRGRLRVIFSIKNGDAEDLVGMLSKRFPNREDRPGFSILKRDKEAGRDIDQLIVEGTEEQLKVVRPFTVRLNESSVDEYNETLANGNRDDSDTITVVRADYAMPKELAMAFEELINKHTGALKVIRWGTRLVPQQRSRPYDPNVKGMVPPSWDTGDHADLPSGTFYYGRLEIIAPADVQKVIENLIDSIVAEQPIDEESATVTLARETYDIGFEQKVFVEVSHAEEHPIDRKPQPPRFRREARTIKRVATELVDLLKAIPSGGQYPVLLVKTNEATLTVTTTPEFQEALGKFIAFLKEQPPADPEQPPPPIDEARAKKLNAEFLLQRARDSIKAGDPKQARRLAAQAQGLNADYDLFSDRPELVLQDLQDATRGTSDRGFADRMGGNSRRLARPTDREASNATSPESWLTPEQQLASLRMQERRIQAELTTINNAIQKGGNRTALSLLIGRNHADNAITRKLVEMLGQAIELEQEKQQLLNNHSMQHPAVLSVQARIDALREMMGLPAGKESQLTELLIIHVESLKLQQQLLRESIEALEESQAESKAEADAKQSFKWVEEQLSPLLSKEAELLQSHGPEHPAVISVQRKIEMTREFLLQDVDDEISDDSPLKLLQLEVERLKDVIRKLEAAHPTDDALPNNTQDEFKPRDEEQSSNNSEREHLARRIRDLEAQLKVSIELLAAIEEGLMEGGAVAGAQRAIDYLESDGYRKQLEAIAADEDDPDLVETSITSAKKFYELVVLQQKLLKEFGAGHSSVEKVERQIDDELFSLKLHGYRAIKNSEYLEFMLEASKAKLRERRNELVTLIKQREAINKSPKSEFPNEDTGDLEFGSERGGPVR